MSIFFKHEANSWFANPDGAKKKCPGGEVGADAITSGKGRSY